MPTKKPDSVRKRGGLREAALAEASKIIADSGVESLSLREVARRLGVSHQAPYRHFATRDHLLAAIVAKAFEEFATALDAWSGTDDPAEDLREMGLAYLRYANEHPLEYRLMFETTLPDPQAHPEMMLRSRHAFALLRDAIARALPGTADLADLDAVYVWSTVHGLASIMRSSAFTNLGLSDHDLRAVVPHLLDRIGVGLVGSLSCGSQPPPGDP